MFYTDDPIADFYAYDAHQTKQLEQLPACADCGEHIQTEEAYYIDGVLICEDCIDSYRVKVEAYESI